MFEAVNTQSSTYLGNQVLRWWPAMCILVCYDIKQYNQTTYQALSFIIITFSCEIARDSHLSSAVLVGLPPSTFHSFQRWFSHLHKFPRAQRQKPRPINKNPTVNTVFGSAFSIRKSIFCQATVYHNNTLSQPCSLTNVFSSVKRNTLL